MPEVAIKGMSCGHCAQAVTRALENLPGVSKVRVDLTTGRVTYHTTTPIAPEDLVRAIRVAGYEMA